MQYIIENVSEFKYLGTTAGSRNEIYNE